MRGLFEFFSIFDWITPSVGFIQDIINDPTPLQSNSWAFFIPYDEALNNGWNAFGIEGMLKQHGIKTWGSQISNGSLFFSVKLEQAQWAEYLLLRNGIPLQECSLGAPQPKRKKKKLGTQKINKAHNDDPLAAIDKFLDDLL